MRHRYSLPEEQLRVIEVKLDGLAAHGRRSGRRDWMLGVVGRVTLHDAMVHVLKQHGGQGMTARQIADEVQASGLYRKRDGSRLELNQIHARVNRYRDLFGKNGTLITLK